MMTIIDRPASEIIQNAGYAALTTGGEARLDGLRTSSCLENIPDCY